MVRCILDISSFLHGCISTWGVRKHGSHAPFKKNPLVWSLWNFFARSAQSPSNMVLHPSNNESCKLKSCRILINAGFRPGISRPFLTRRISRIGSMPAPTFSSSPRIKAGQVSNTPLSTEEICTHLVVSQNTSEGLPRGRHHSAPSQSRWPGAG
jgi:hypothetical protein